MSVRILSVAGNQEHIQRLRELFSKERLFQCNLETACSIAEAIQQLDSYNYDILLVDITQATLTSAEKTDDCPTLHQLLRCATPTPVIVITDHNEDPVAVNAVQQGAADYLVKSELTTALLVRAIRYAIEHSRNQALLKAIPDTMFLMDREGITQDYHASRPADLLIPPEEFLGRSVRELFPPAISQQLIKTYQAAIDSGEMQQLEVALPIGGKHLHLEVRVAPYGSDKAMSIVRNITDRKSAEDELRMAEAKYRNLVEQLPAFVYIDRVVNNSVDSVIYVSPYVETILGYPPEAFKADPLLWYNLIDPIDRAGNQSYDHEHFVGRKPFQQEYRMRTRDGRTIWVRDAAVILPSTEQGVVYSQGVVTDVTEQKRIEQALRSSEETNRALLQAIPDLMFVVSREGIYLDGYAGRPEDLVTDIANQIGRNVRDILPPELSDQILAANERSFAQQQMQSVEYSLDLANGLQYYEARIVPCGEDKVLSIVRNVTERRNAEEALRSKEEEYRTLFENIPLGIFRSSPDGHPLRSNPAMVELDGYSSEEEQIRNVQNIGREWYVEPHRRDEFQRLLSEYGEVRSFESEIYRHKTRERIWVSENAIAVRDAQGKILYYEGTVNDITARKRSEEALQRLNAELAQALKLKDEFLANMSHELRTPLSVILTLCESLIEGLYGATSARQVDVLLRVQKSGRHLLALIADILDLAKVQSGTLELDLRTVFIQETCQTSIQMVQQAAAKKQIKLFSKLDTTVKTIIADERRLVQILVNLLTNAIKFTPEEGSVGVEVSHLEEQEITRFTVWDTGIGISPDDQKKLFRPFIQLDAGLARRSEGVGLGLALVHRLAELHNGSVVVESAVGKGSRFTVTIPWKIIDSSLVDQSHLLNGAAVQVGYVATPGQNGWHPSSDTIENSPLILLAEDNLFASQAFEEYLQFLAYRVVTAHNGLEAISLAEQHHPDLILMDVQMPDIDGLEATRQIRAQVALAKTPIIALTALAMPGDRERCLEAGCVDYVSKPIELPLLAQMIKAHLPQYAEPRA